jgi:flagellar P-ring protein precursor FlgI
VGTIPNGALVERGIQVPLDGRSSFRFVLNRTSFITARRAVEAINARWGRPIARCLDGRNIEVRVPPAYRGRVGEFLAAVQSVEVRPDSSGKIVVDERTGTIVMGEMVRIEPVAVAQGGLTVIIKERPQVSQPQPFAPPPGPAPAPARGQTTGADLAPGGQTVVVPRTEIQVEERAEGLVLLDGGVTIGELVRALNAIGVSPRQLISILQAIHRAGALHAQLEVI